MKTKFTKVYGLYSVLHKQFCTDHYELGSTIVQADSKQEAMNKLNNYIKDNPSKTYDEPCTSLTYVNILEVLK